MGIPTTYYGAVQLTGAVTVTDDVEAIAAILRRQLADVEPDGGLQDPLVHTKQFKAIRGIEMQIVDVRAKFKYGGNADEEHRAAVAKHLQSRNGPGDQAASGLICNGISPPNFLPADWGLERAVLCTLVAPTLFAGGLGS